MWIHKVHCYREFSVRLHVYRDNGVWQCPGKGPEAQAEDRMKWSEESAGRPRLDQLPVISHQPETGHEEERLKKPPP